MYKIAPSHNIRRAGLSKVCFRDPVLIQKPSSIKLKKYRAPTCSVQRKHTELQCKYPLSITSHTCTLNKCLGREIIDLCHLLNLHKSYMPHVQLHLHACMYLNVYRSYIRCTHLRGAEQGFITGSTHHDPSNLQLLILTCIIPKEHNHNLTQL